MISNPLIRLALRAQAFAVTVCTTGSITMAATATGYTRATGSFLTDGFAVGHELAPSGYTSNPVDTITAVSALSLTTANAHPAQSAGSGRVLRVGIPALRNTENLALAPIAGRWYVSEDYAGPTQTITTMTARGWAEYRGLYVLKVFGVENTGSLALDTVADAVLAAFPADSALSVSDGHTVRIGGKPAPYRSQILAGPSGWSVLSITIPWWCQSATPS